MSREPARTSSLIADTCCMKKTAQRKRSYVERLRPDVLASVILITLGFLFFADILFSSKNFYYRDILNFHYPLRKILIDSYANGRLPLWNPFIYLGQPMLANPNYMAFYPTNLFHLVLSFNYAFKLHFLIHPILGGLGTYFFLRRLALRSIPALAGAIAYQFSGPVLSFLNLYNLLPATALIPWIGWTFQGALRGHRVRRTMLFGFLLALQVIAFEPILFQCCIFLILALSIFYLLEQENRKGALRILVFVLCPALAFAAGLAAVQIVPTLELLPLSARGSGLGYSMASGWSMHPVDLMNLFVPNFYGVLYTIDSTASWGEAFHEFREAYLVSFFMGSVTLLLAAMAFFSARSRLRTVLGSFAALSLLLALGKFAPLYPLLYRHLPLFDLGRYPCKYFLLTALLVSMLAAMGLEAIIDRLAAQRMRWSMKGALVAGLAAGGVFLCLGLMWTAKSDGLAAMVRDATPSKLADAKNYPAIAAGLARSFVATGAFLMLGAFIPLAWQRIRRSAEILGVLLLLLLAGELMPQNIGLSPLISDADVDYVPELADLIRQQGPDAPFRSVTPDYLTPEPDNLILRAPNRSVAWRVLYNKRSGRNLDGIRQKLQYSLDRPIDYLNSRESAVLADRGANLPEANKLTLLANLNCPMVPAIGEVQDPRLTLLGTMDTHSNLDYRLYRLKDVLPRAYFATGVIQTRSAEESLNRLLEATSPLHNTVILDSAPGLETRPASTDLNSVRITRYENNRVACEIRAMSAGYLVLLDSWYPGWKAYLDGQRVDVLRANYAFRAVAVNPGAHHVEFVFKPVSFYIGATISCTALLIGAVAAIFAAAIRRRAAAAETRNG